MIRSSRILGMLVAALMLPQSVSASAAEQAEQETPKIKPIKAGQYPWMILPEHATKLPAIGEVIEVKDKEAFVSIPLGWLSVAELHSELIFEYAGQKLKLPAGAKLHGAWAEGGSFDFDVDKVDIYCADPKNDLIQGALDVFTLGLASVFSNKSTFTQFCVVDVDKDGTFDKAFLEGMKGQEFQGSFAIAPTQYEKKMMQPHPNSSIEFSYSNGDIFGGPKLEYRFKGKALHNGVVTQIDAINARGRKQIFYNYMGVDRKKLPDTNNLFGARVQVIEMSKNKKIIKLKLLSHPSTYMIVPHYHQTRVILI